MSEEMYNNGYQNITNIDISEIVINKMKTSYQDQFKNMICKSILLI